MNTFTTKFSIGDKVWCASTTMTTKSHPCPDCLGEKKWSAQSPAGTDYKFDCPRCSANYLSDSDLSLRYPVFVPTARRLTIGSVRVDTADVEHPVSYMCVETGVGSGSIYDEGKLFATEEEAVVAAAVMAKQQNTTVPHVVKAFDKSLTVKDYQMSEATLDLGRRMKTRLRDRISWFIDDLKHAESMDEVKETIENFINRPSSED